MAALLLGAVVASATADESDHPLTERRRDEIRSELDQRIERLTRAILAEPESVRLRVARGSAYLHRGQFTKAASDLDKAVEIDPQRASRLWQRGIALYYAGRFRDSARQFEQYHHFDNVDRENGIWRFLAQAKAFGPEKARQTLLEYEKDDRPPFPDLYLMFAGKLTPGEVLRRIGAADVTDAERDKRLFYAHLYIGLFEDARDRKESAREHLRQAVANRWGQQASGGPGFMWHVARIHYEALGSEPKRGAGTPARDRRTP